MKGESRSTVENRHAGGSPASWSRRSFLGWAGRVGIVVVGGAAGLAGLSDPAAAYCGLQYSPCCCLGSSRKCANGCRFTCPSGYHRTAWYCATSSGSRVFGCGECAAGTTCHSGPYYCSVYWDDAYC